MKVESVRGGGGGRVRECLESSHVVESQVKLLTEGFTLQLLSVHLVWREGWTQRTERWTDTQDGNRTRKKVEEKKSQITEILTSKRIMQI